MLIINKGSFAIGMQDGFTTPCIAYVDNRHGYWYPTDKTKGCRENKLVVWHQFSYEGYTTAFHN